MVTVVAVPADRWREFREIRLAALQDAPSAFTSTYEREVAFGEDTWRERAEMAAWFAAYDDAGGPVGIAIGFHEAGAPPDVRELVSMWVAPPARGQGIAGELIRSVADWARADGAAALRLWVVDGNDAARRAYERAGFLDTGERAQVVPGDPRIECRMVLEL